MKKTPLAKLIDNLWLLMSVQANPAVCHGINDSINEAEKLLEEERQNLIDIYDDGLLEGLGSEFGSKTSSGHEHFNENYEQ